jgi:iron complex outermembrane receptor protein
MARKSLGLVVFLVFCAIGVANSQQSGASDTASASAPSELSEIVITAVRRRGEDVQTTPIAITALDSSMLERNHVERLDDLPGLVPNLQIQQASGSGGTESIYLRGFGAYASDPATEPHIASFIDGIYQPAVVGGMMDLFDLAQVEVDAGPQGTLLGKNAPVGAMYVTTAPPQDKFGGELEADYGRFDRVAVRGKVTGPLLNNADGGALLTGKVSFVYRNGGDWIRNEYNGTREFGGTHADVGRLALDFTPTANFKWSLVGTVDDETISQQGDRQTGFYGGVPGSSSNATQLTPAVCLFYGGVCPRTQYGTTDSNWTAPLRFRLTEVSSNMSYRFEPFTVSSVTGYIKYWQHDNANDSGTPFSALNIYGDVLAYDQESEELRISSNKGGGWTFNDKIDWLVGGYASNFNYKFNNILGILNGSPLEPNVGPQFANVKSYEKGVTQSYAAFLHAIFNFSDQWTGTYGVRRSWDYKTHDYQAPGTTSFAADQPADFNNTSMEVGTAYQFDANHLAYVRWAQGYQSGGYAGFALGNVYQPEYNTAYEFGLKGDYLDKRLRVNLAFFLNQLTNLQVSSALPSPNPPGFIQETLNAGAATTQGIELQSVAVLTNRLIAHLDVGYLLTRYQRYDATVCSNTGLPTDCSGVPFSFSPKWTIGLGEEYVRDLPNNLGSLTLSSHVSFKSTLYPIDPPFPSARQAGYALVNGGVTWTDPTKMYSAELYGTNIFNKHYIWGYGDPGGLIEWANDGRPAEWGIRAAVKF